MINLVLVLGVVLLVIAAIVLAGVVVFRKQQERVLLRKGRQSFNEMPLTPAIRR